MGWSSGSELLGGVLELTEKYIPKKHKKEVVKNLIDLFEDQDCDTICEVFDDYPIVEEVYREMHPEEFEDEDE